MPVGATIGASQIDNIITALAVRWRQLAQDTVNLSLSVNGQGQGLAYLTALGKSADPNPDNPGGVSDAALALAMISYMNTNAGVYLGTATQATAFNFNQVLAQCWAGQVTAS